MSTKVRYEYLVTGIAEDGYPVSDLFETRSKARAAKNEFKDFYGCSGTKILQRKFRLELEKQVR